MHLGAGKSVILTCLIHLLTLVAQINGQQVITDFRVSTSIERRYAVTNVISRMKNTNTAAAELQFKMALPKTAFISSLIMEIAGVNYTSTVKEKEAARRTYDSARKRGKTTGIVEQRQKDSQKFEVSANVAGGGKVTFYLKYEELLLRVKGHYTYAVEIKPGHVIPTLSVDVHIVENEKINNFEVLQYPGKEESLNNSVTNYGVQEQLEPGDLWYRNNYEDSTGTGIDGVFSFTYDIDRHPDGGEIQRVGDFFVHYFSPEGLPKMPSHTIFVLDVSGSMGGDKLQQLKEAMKAILKDLHEDDTFELMVFSDNVQSLGTFSGKKKPLKEALKKVERLRILGGTNLNDAYVRSLRNINSLTGVLTAKQVVFLTDGQATSGITNSEAIRKNARQANDDRHPIYGLAFGGGADLELLKRVSADNRGFARQIESNQDTASQLKGFYEEIATPLMSEVNVIYLEDEVDRDSVVKHGTSNFYAGGEVVLAGLMVPGASRVQPTVEGMGKEGPLQFQVDRYQASEMGHISEKDNFVARLWAYLQVQDLLAQADVTDDKTHAQDLKKKALEIALRFDFVTKLTSLVVVRPEDDDPAEEEVEDDVASSSPLPVQRGAGTAQHASPHSGASNIVPSGFQPSSNSARLYRGGGFQRGSRGGGSHVDNDPHFVVYAPEMDLPVCFDLHAHDGAFLSLVRDPVTGIVVNGQVTSAITMPDLTYFTTLFLSLGHINVTVTTNDVRVTCHTNSDMSQEIDAASSLWPFYKKNGKINKKLKKKSRRSRKGHKRRLQHSHRSKRSTADMQDHCSQRIPWRNQFGRKYGNVFFIMRRKSLHFNIGDSEVHFTILRSRSKHGQHFLGFYIKKQEMLSEETGGIIGQFTAKNISLSSSFNATVLANGKTKQAAAVQVQRLTSLKTYEVSEVSGILSSRRSLLTKTHVQCLHIRNSGRGVLDGRPQDYILHCLRC